LKFATSGIRAITTGRFGPTAPTPNLLCKVYRARQSAHHLVSNAATRPRAIFAPQICSATAWVSVFPRRSAIRGRLHPQRSLTALGPAARIVLSVQPVAMLSALAIELPTPHAQHGLHAVLVRSQWHLERPIRTRCASHACDVELGFMQQEDARPLQMQMDPSPSRTLPALNVHSAHPESNLSRQRAHPTQTLYAATVQLVVPISLPPAAACPPLIPSAQTLLSALQISLWWSIARPQAIASVSNFPSARFRSIRFSLTLPQATEPVRILRHAP